MWLRRIRGAIGMGITWAIVWGLAGLGIGALSLVTPWLPWDTFFRVFDAPLPALAVPGFVGGMLFSLVLGVAARHRRFEELSLPRFTAFGAVGGVLLSLVPAATLGAGLGTLREGLNIWQLTAAISIPTVLLGAASAAATLSIARKGERQLAAEPARDQLGT